jgi:conjugative transfer signal peptidase TraF
MILRAGALLVLGSLIAWVAAQTSGIRINMTASMPRGLYRIAPLLSDSRRAAHLVRGMAVTACLPRAVARLALRRGYIGPGNCPAGGEPVLKVLAAIAGDVVRVTTAGISVDGVLLHNSAALLRDGAGRTMPHVPAGLYRVGPGDVWLLSTRVPDSWDSRYFGPVPTSELCGIARPVWVIE